MAWSKAQVAWLKANDPAKLARGYANRKKGPSIVPKNEKQRQEMARKAAQASGGTGGPVGQNLVNLGGRLPSMQEFTSQGQWFLGSDPGDPDYGRKFSGKDAKYYQNFMDTANRY